MENKNENRKTAIIIGAGPAGLTAAYRLLTETDIKPIVLEGSPYIGGISRTAVVDGNRMDIGGHRFFSKNEEVNALWEELMPLQGKPSFDDKKLGVEKPLAENGPDPETEDRVMLLRNRISRIFFLRKFFDYPITLKPETFKNMGFKNTMRSGFGYIGSAIHKKPEDSLENFYINRFGRPLYEMFFEDYTTKLWGRHPSQISADWGAQRVKGLSLMKAVWNVLSKPFRPKDKVETSLIEQYYYPKFGPGQLWETLADEVKKRGGSADVRRIAGGLPYRDFITVGLLVDKLKMVNKTKHKTLTGDVPDCWIYIQERDVKLGRLQLFNNWSPYMVADPEHTMWIGLEYFCNEGDDMWNMSDEDFISFAIDELVKIDVIDRASVKDSKRIRVKKAYPAYFDTYAEFDTVKDYLSGIDNLWCLGRNGQHRYNNMDHSMLTAMEAVRAIAAGSTDKSAVWNVNTEKEYHETKNS